MPKPAVPCRLFPIRGDRGALANGIGDRGFAGNLQQALARMLLREATALRVGLPARLGHSTISPLALVLLMAASMA